MSNSHAEANWKYNDDNDDYNNKDGRKALLAESTKSTVVGNTTLRSARSLKNCNPFIENETYNVVVDENVKYTNHHRHQHHQHDIDEQKTEYKRYERNYNQVTVTSDYMNVSNEEEHQAISTYQVEDVTNHSHHHHHQHPHHHSDWHDDQVDDEADSNQENENASYNYEENYDGDDEYSTNFAFDEVDDYYGEAVGGCGSIVSGGDESGNSGNGNGSGSGGGDGGGEIYWSDEENEQQLSKTEMVEIGEGDSVGDVTGTTDDYEHDNDDDPQNNRFVSSEIEQSFDSEGNFHFEDIYNESDFELDDEGHVIFKCDPVKVEYRTGMTIEEMGKLLERAKECQKSTH